MKKFAIALALVSLTAVSVYAEGHISGSINDDGKIVVTATQPQPTAGLNFQSAGGHLVPGEAPTPFLFYLSNTPNSVVYAIVPGTVTLDGDLVTQTGYAGDDPVNDLTLSYGAGGGVEVAFPVQAPVVIPEPASGLMAVFGLLGLLGFRRRRG